MEDHTGLMGFREAIFAAVAAIHDDMTMDPKNIIKVSTRAELRQWFEDNHCSCKEMWVRVNRGKTPAEGTVGYVDSVMEALCFGWIDSTVKKVDDGFPLQRFSPRRKGSHWTELNRQRCRQLITEGLMTEAGLIEYNKSRSSTL